MKTYLEAGKILPVADEVDVLVAGGGPAGVGAAIAAARNGAKTMLIEHFNCLGGIATSGLMSHWTGASEGPIYEEILNRCQSCGSHVSMGSMIKCAFRPSSRCFFASFVAISR